MEFDKKLIDAEKKRDKHYKKTVFGLYVRRLRLAGATKEVQRQAHIAGRVGVTHTIVSNCEIGAALISSDVVQAYARAYDASVIKFMNIYNGTTSVYLPNDSHLYGAILDMEELARVGAELAWEYTGAAPPRARARRTLTPAAVQAQLPFEAGNAAPAPLVSTTPAPEYAGMFNFLSWVTEKIIRPNDAAGAAVLDNALAVLWKNRRRG